MSTYLIGLCGATNSGKTTVVKKLSERFHGEIIHQDYYFRVLEQDPSILPYDCEMSCFNWEDISTVDMKRLHEDLQVLLACDNKTCFIDGITLFQDKGLLERMDKRYFLTLDKQTCWERRQTRTYDPPDVPGYFEKYVWPYYMRYYDEAVAISQTHNVMFIDGLLPADTVYSLIEADLEKFFNQITAP